MVNIKLQVIKKFNKGSIQYVELKSNNNNKAINFITQSVGSANYEEYIKNGEKIIIMPYDAYVITAKKLLI